MEQNQQPSQGRRGNFHRGRRGSERRSQERREPSPSQPEQSGRGGEHVDVEQIMRDIRARIAQRHGIELSNQQVQELAARRLEAILDPRTVSPALLEQLRKSAGTPSTNPLTEKPAEPAYTFEEDTLFESHRGVLRFIRALLKPILKLFFNPNPLIRALNLQAKLNAEAAARDGERDRRQTEWNALHYELLQRMVTETARLSIEVQSLSLKADALGGKVDFNERRVRSIEGAIHQPQGHQPQSRPQPPRIVDAAPAPVVATTAETGSAAATVGTAGATAASGPAGSADGTRRRRRRRRGRRGNGTLDDASTGLTAAGTHAFQPSDSDAGADDEGDDEGQEPMPAAESDAHASASNRPLRPLPVIAAPAPEPAAAPEPVVNQGTPATSQPEVPEGTAPSSTLDAPDTSRTEG